MSLATNGAVVSTNVSQPAKQQLRVCFNDIMFLVKSTINSTWYAVKTAFTHT